MTLRGHLPQHLGVVAASLQELSRWIKAVTLIRLAAKLLRRTWFRIRRNGDCPLKMSAEIHSDREPLEGHLTIEAESRFRKPESPPVTARTSLLGKCSEEPSSGLVAWVCMTRGHRQPRVFPRVPYIVEVWIEIL